ncbi:hypothetical protein DAMA08_030840 [Martiniozyma asiatica (nom. inval.)]|nr:hypothetical protein DAMA08_030840 [Martiniozyma asiatica]
MSRRGGTNSYNHNYDHTNFNGSSRGGYYYDYADNNNNRGSIDGYDWPYDYDHHRSYEGVTVQEREFSNTSFPPIPTGPSANFPIRRHFSMDYNSQYGDYNSNRHIDENQLPRSFSASVTPTPVSNLMTSINSSKEDSFTQRHLISGYSSSATSQVLNIVFLDSIMYIPKPNLELYSSQMEIFFPPDVIGMWPVLSDTIGGIKAFNESTNCHLLEASSKLKFQWSKTMIDILSNLTLNESNMLVIPHIFKYIEHDLIELNKSGLKFKYIISTRPKLHSKVSKFMEFILQDIKIIPMYSKLKKINLFHTGEIEKIKIDDEIKIEFVPIKTPTCSVIFPDPKFELSLQAAHFAKNKWHLSRSIKGFGFRLTIDSARLLVKKINEWGIWDDDLPIRDLVIEASRKILTSIEKDSFLKTREYNTNPKRYLNSPINDSGELSIAGGALHNKIHNNTIGSFKRGTVEALVIEVAHKPGQICLVHVMVAHENTTWLWEKAVIIVQQNNELTPKNVKELIRGAKWEKVKSTIKLDVMPCQFIKLKVMSP